MTQPTNNGSGAPGGPANQPQDVYVFPISLAQRRLWFLDQLLPGSPAYNIPVSLRLRGDLNVSALQRAFDEIVARHESLRTTFAQQGGEPVQVVAPTGSMAITRADFKKLAAEESEAEARRLLGEEGLRGFDLQHGPLLRALLIALGERDHVLCVTMHHIVTDGRSLQVLVQELSALYDAFSRDLPSPLPPLPIQYADFTLWQQEWLGTGELDEQLAYWKQQLNGVTPLRLPTDRIRPAEPSSRGGRVEFSLPAEVADKLRSLSQKENATLFMTLLAAYQVLLCRHSDEADICVGSPIANRSRSELDGLIGFFANTLALRGDLSGDPTFREFLQRIRKMTLEAYRHQDVPFEKLVQELQPDRDLSRNPLFQASFSLEQDFSHDLKLANLAFAPFAADIVSTHFDLEAHFVDSPQGISGSLVYSSELFDAETARRMADHFCALLESIAASPDQHVSQLRLMADAERRQVIEDWNRTERAYPGEKSLAELFEQQAARSPEAVAVVFGGQERTYAELNRQANQLARLLQKRGVTRGTLVGVCLERSADMIVALLAIVKAGGAYVPLDPVYPAERLTMMLVDAQAPVVIAQERTLSRVPNDWGEVICLERESGEIAAMSDANLAIASRGEDLAYVMYTSGSTGTPKGIEVEQRSVSRLVLNTDYIALGPNDRVAQASNTSFDAATFEIWGALLNGARLVGIEKEVMLSANTLAREIESRGVTTMFLTTALFNQLVQQRPGMFGKMRNVLFGGEAVDPKQVRKVLEAGGPERLLHVYGPTETTTFATWQLVTEVAEE
ncbi:MAG TPA: condensation domain-containing protein, partial [Verrucomicrobiae bacterium]|nr:condensation domain-containing protein [Verrucomicrobiae bacterium]